MSIIYRITNTINGKSYIGQTVQDLLKRWNCHYNEAKRNMYKNKFHNAVRKYTKDIWNIEILERVEDINLLNEREIYWISLYDTFKNGYNSTTGGMQNKEYSLESREKMSKSHKGVPLSETHRINSGLAHRCKRRPRPLEANKRHSELMKGRNLGKKDSLETKERKRQAALKREETKRLNKSIT